MLERCRNSFVGAIWSKKKVLARFARTRAAHARGQCGKSRGHRDESRQRRAKPQRKAGGPNNSSPDAAAAAGAQRERDVEHLPLFTQFAPVESGRHPFGIRNQTVILARVLQVTSRIV